MTSETAEREPSSPQRRKGPLAFLREVRAEGRKVTWATRQEVLVSTVMVVIFVIMAGVFFFVIDQILRWAVELILGL